jgi:hypothetical protein
MAAIIFSVRGAYWSSIKNVPSAPMNKPILPPFPVIMYICSVTGIVIVFTSADSPVGASDMNPVNKTNSIDIILPIIFNLLVKLNPGYHEVGMFSYTLRCAVLFMNIHAEL